MRHATILCTVMLTALAAGSLIRASDEPAKKPNAAASGGNGWIALFNGKDLSGWKFRNPDAKKTWVMCDDVRLDPADDARLLPQYVPDRATHAVYLCGEDGRGSDIMTERDFYDYELHVEFTVPRGSNSGVYNRGLYEIQVLDSFGKPELDFHDCGALYERAKPALNLAKRPAEWQTFDIRMEGHKISLVWNGTAVFKDMDVRYGETDKEAFERLNHENASKAPELRVKLEEKDGKYTGFFGNGGTRASLPGTDRPGPILLQGDHGPVAYRNLKIRPLDKPNAEAKGK
jgi:hypothetical protein